MDFLTLIYILLAGLAVAGSAAVVLTRDTVHSALSLVGVMLCLAGMFLLMHLEFVAAIQVIVYAGAIMVLFLFAIMMLNLREREHWTWQLRGVRFLGGLAAMIFFFLVGVGAYVFALPGGQTGGQAPVTFSVREIAEVMLSKYVLAFELTSVLLLVAIVGAIIMARRSSDESSSEACASQSASQDSRP